ncbi:histidine kinase, partial [Aureobasidium melanogenum]
MSPNSTSSQSCSGSLFSSLTDINSLLEFLSDDDRPTFLIEVLSSNVAVPHIPRVVFQNAAFTSFLERTVTKDSYDDWLRSLSTSVAIPSNRPVKPFGGRAWSSKRFRNAWRVVYCSQWEDDRRLDSVAEASTEPDNPSQEDTDMTGSEHDHQHSSWLHAQEKIIDWTRFPSKVRQTTWIDFIKTYPFEKTYLGPMSQWSDELRRLAVQIMFSPFPRMVYWGEEQAILYNQAASALLGSKHPNFALGNRFMDVWGPEIHEKHMKMIRAALDRGIVAEAKEMEAILERNGFIEETYWDVVLQPCSGPDGQMVAVLNTYQECTSSVFQHQRRTVIDKVQAIIPTADNFPDLWTSVAKELRNNLHDAAYSLIYTAVNQPLDSDHTHAIDRVETFQLELQITSGVPAQTFESVVHAGERFHRPSLGPVFAEARKTQQVVVLQQDRLPPELALLVPDRGFVTTACVLPIASVSGQQIAFIVLGMNPRRLFTDESRLFLSHMNDLISKAAALISLPEEQRRDQEKFEQINFALSQQLQIIALKAEKNEETFTRMAQNAPFGMYMFDRDGNPKYVNDAYLRLIGLDRDTFEQAASRGLAWKDTIYEEDIDLATSIWTRMRDSKTAQTFEYRVKVPPVQPGEKPDIRTIETISFPEIDQSGCIVTVQGWLMDISPRKRLESLMAQRLEDALETRRASENFIDMVSHEMRNPLSAILQLADGILGSLDIDLTKDPISLPADTIDMMVDAAQTITLCAQHQKCIVDDILTLSKLDSSLLVITPDKVHPPTLIEKSLKMYDAELARADIEAKLVIEQSYLDARLNYVMLDPSRVLQVIINLLTNGIKFTRDCPTRKISVYLSAFEKPPVGGQRSVTFIEPRPRQSSLSTSPEWGPGGEVYIQFAVQDTGKGLTEDELKLLWQRFSQANPKTYKQYGGSGLGLFISRELTELQGGQIGVHSEAGVGSTFMFYIKARRCVDEPKTRQTSFSAPTASSPVLLPHTASEARRANVSEGSVHTLSSLASTVPPEDIHILVVEDNRINQRVMSQQLRKLGCVVHTADHGQDCLDFLQTTIFTSNSKNIPLSIILMDLEMPVMDGLTCVRRIREYEATGKVTGHVPVIAITANARSEQINIAMEAGMDTVVTKPFRIPDLVPRMQSLLSENRAK